MTSIIVILGLMSLASTVIGRSNLTVEFQWKFLAWTNPDAPVIQKPYIRENSFLIDIDIDKFGRIFVTSPQWQNGVPVTLSLVTNIAGPGGPLLTPYPNWSWHNSNDCDKIISVYRIAIDKCNRLWLLDVGRIGSNPICPVKIMIFDLTTDELIHKYIVPNDQSWNGTNLVTPIVEIGRTCRDAHLYVADVKAYGILMYDLRNDRSWRLNNTEANAFGYGPEAEEMTIAGETFRLTDGTIGMSLSPEGFFRNRYLYFNSLSSFYEKLTDVRSLKLAEYADPEIYRTILKRPSQAGVQATSRTGATFFFLVERHALACWNIENPFVPEYIEVIAQDVKTLQYMSGVKIIENKFGQEELWFVTNRLQKIMRGTRKMTEVNFRVIRGFVDDLIRNTRCESRGLAVSHPDISSWRRIQ